MADRFAETFAGEGRNPRVGEPVIWTQNDERGRVIEERLGASGNAWLVRFESGYEAWFPANALIPNREVS